MREVEHLSGLYIAHQFVMAEVRLQRVDNSVFSDSEATSTPSQLNLKTQHFFFGLAFHQH